jgi:hypothetical protein
VPGEEVFVEFTGREAPRFEIDEIVHFDHDPYGREQSEIGRDTAEVLLPCHKDVNCYSGVPVNARKATGQMIYQSGGTSHSCTGTLINDLDGETRVPYFLTARHCISTAGAASSLVVTWLYETDYCINNGGTVPDPSTLQKSEGATIMRTQSENDMSFLRLDGGVPSGTALAGWTTATSISGWGVHHPQGSWKRMARLTPVGLCVTCVCLDPTDYDYYDMDIGLVQGGSSGSGIFNSSSQIAGQLRKRCFDSQSMNCSNISDYFAVYGEFETTYDDISHWLFLGGTVNVNWFTFPNMPETGTPGFPFDTVVEGYNYAWPGARLKIQTGTYPEDVTFAKEMMVVAAGGSVLIGG